MWQLGVQRTRNCSPTHWCQLPASCALLCLLSMLRCAECRRGAPLPSRTASQPTACWQTPRMHATRHLHSARVGARAGLCQGQSLTWLGGLPACCLAALHRDSAAPCLSVCIAHGRAAAPMLSPSPTTPNCAPAHTPTHTPGCAGLKATFFDPATPAAIKQRMEGGKDQDLKDVLKVTECSMWMCGCLGWRAALRRSHAGCCCPTTCTVACCPCCCC